MPSGEGGPMPALHLWRVTGALLCRAEPSQAGGPAPGRGQLDRPEAGPPGEGGRPAAVGDAGGGGRQPPFSAGAERRPRR